MILKNNILRLIARLAMVISAILMMDADAFAQQEKKFIKDGNAQYNAKKYAESEQNFKAATQKNKNSYPAAFNLGDAYYQQGKYEEAAAQFQALTHRATSKDTLARAYHNLGNSLLKSKKYDESIQAYKNALKNNPSDDDTRYNLSYAQQMLKQQQQQQQKKNDKDKDQNKKDQNKKDKNKKDQQNKDKKDPDKKDQQNKDQQKQDPQISKEDAKRILDALQNDEKNLQDKVKKGKAKGMKVQIEKDW